VAADEDLQAIDKGKVVDGVAGFVIRPDLQAPLKGTLFLFARLYCRLQSFDQADLHGFPITFLTAQSSLKDRKCKLL
jgi:hypothetical protein